MPCLGFFIDLHKGAGEVEAGRYIVVLDSFRRWEVKTEISAVHPLAVGTVISGTNGLSKAGVQLLQLSLGQIRRSGAITG